MLCAARRDYCTRELKGHIVDLRLFDRPRQRPNLGTFLRPHRLDSVQEQQ